MIKRIFKYSGWFLASNILVTNAFAVAAGFYMGGMFGPATNGASATRAQVRGSATTTPAKPRSTQYGTSLLMGYKNNPYVGSEYGFTYYSGIDYDTSNVDTCSSVNTRVYDLHALLRLSYPWRSVEPFVKIGVAGVHQTNSGALNPDLTSDCGKSEQQTKFAPSYAIGVGYDLSQNWVADVSLNRLQAGGQARNMDWFAIGITYHFVDEYCGQFLC